MARVAIIIDHVADAHGKMWDVREKRPTPHGFDVMLGWPVEQPRGQGGGGPRVIITPDLAAYLEAVRLRPAAVDLPIGRTALKRLRAALGHNWLVDNCRWWQDNPDGPGKCAGAVTAQKKLRGMQIKKWSRDEVFRATLMRSEGKSYAAIAEDLGRSVQGVMIKMSRNKKRAEGEDNE